MSRPFPLRRCRRPPWRRLSALAALLVLAGGVAGCFRAEPPGTRVVLITLDTLRFDTLFGPDGSTGMPRLSAWAGENVSFERFYAAVPATLPTHATMFTGLHPWQHGVQYNKLRLLEEHQTLAERLREEGFRTAAVVASYPVSRRSGLDQGFDRFDDDFDLVKPDLPPKHPSYGQRFYSLATTITERALALISSLDGDRQFLWFHYFDAHDPYGDAAGAESLDHLQILAAAKDPGRDVAAELDRARRLYDADAAVLDRELDRLLAELERQEDRFTTHVLITADHGESLGDDGSLGHGGRLTPFQIHVPLLIRSPRLPPGTRRDVAGSVDVAATLASFADLPAGAFGGRNLTVPDDGRGRALGLRRDLGPGPWGDKRVDGGRSRIRGHLFYWVDGDGTLYRGTADELLPAAGDPPPEDLTPRLTELFSTFQQQLDRAEKAPADPEVERALRALGYLG